MKKITLLFTICAFLMANVINAQTVVWSSDLEDLTGWGTNDLDGDTNNWLFYVEDASSIAVGFSGKYASSYSWSNVALTPRVYVEISLLVNYLSSQEQHLMPAV